MQIETTLDKIRQMQQERKQRTQSIMQQQQQSININQNQAQNMQMNPIQQQPIQNKLNTPYHQTDFQQNKLANLMNRGQEQQPTMPNMSQNIMANQVNTTQDMLQRLRSANQSNQALQAPLQSQNNNNSSVINEGLKYQGTKYKWGGNDLTKGVDCSGLTQQLFKQQGVNLPRTAAEQAKGGKSVSITDLQPGDLVFFDTVQNNGKSVDHVGIYQGNGQMLHASSSKGVTTSDFNKKYWQSKFVTAKRY